MVGLPGSEFQDAGRYVLFFGCPRPGSLLPSRLSAAAARMRSFKAASLILSPSWMSMARLTFPSRLELNKPKESFNAAPLAKVILTAFLKVFPLQTIPPWDQTGVPGLVAFTHFHSSTISGSAACMISRTLASAFPRQSPSCLIFLSMDSEAFMCSSNLATKFSCAQPNLQLPGGSLVPVHKRHELD